MFCIRTATRKRTIVEQEYFEGVEHTFGENKKVTQKTLGGKIAAGGGLTPLVAGLFCTCALIQLVSSWTDAQIRTPQVSAALIRLTRRLLQTLIDIHTTSTRLISEMTSQQVVENRSVSTDCSFCGIEIRCQD